MYRIARENFLPKEDVTDMETRSGVSKKVKAAPNTTHLARAIGTMAMIWAIWKIPARLAEKHLKNIHI